MTASTRLAATAAVLACAALTGPHVATATTPLAPATFDVQGTIRWTSPTTWVALTDAGHQPVNIATVTPLTDRVRVTYTQSAAKVITCSVTPDESFAAAAVRVGASVGLNQLDVFFYMGTSQTPVNPALLTRRNANVWVDCTHQAVTP